MRRLRPCPDFSPGVATFFSGRLRAFRISWLVVGTAANGTGPTRYAHRVDSERPILALDVDGVISVFGFDGPIEQLPGPFHLIDGMAHCIPQGIGGPAPGLPEDKGKAWAAGRGGRATRPPPGGSPHAW